LHIKYGDGTEKLILKPMSIWKDGAKSVEIKLERFRDIASISLDTETVPDIDKSNSSISFSSNH